MICRQLNDGPCKTYLLVSETTREAVLVDPLLERCGDYVKLLRAEGLRLTHALDTHTHADHLSGCLWLREETGAAHVMHEASRARGLSRPVVDGETLGVGDVKMTFLHTPGHTRDSVTVLLGDRLLSGDFLFIGSYGAGRLDLPGSDVSAHFDSLKRLDALSDGVVVLPGHDYAGARQSSLGVERKANPVLSPRARDAYLRWWSERRFEPAEWMGAVVKANVAGTKDALAVPIPNGTAACACAAGPVPATGPEISPEELCSLIGKRPAGLVLLDVRTQEEYSDDGHIADAILIPVDELAGRLGEVPEGEVISICRSGKRAARAAALLEQAGRRAVRVLTGGMLAWNERRLPVA